MRVVAILARGLKHRARQRRLRIGGHAGRHCTARSDRFEWLQELQEIVAESRKNAFAQN